MSRPGVLVKHLALRGPHLSARRNAGPGGSPTPILPSRSDARPTENHATDLTGAVPVAGSPPVPVADVAPGPEPLPELDLTGVESQLSWCEIDPEMYRVFAYAVLGWHRRMPKAGGDRCACGKAWLDCEYVDLADKLLWTGSGTWCTQSA
jgi:hypothetical protein